MHNYTYFRQFYEKCLKQNILFTYESTEKNQLYLLEQHSESFKFGQQLLGLTLIMIWNWVFNFTS